MRGKIIKGVGGFYYVKNDMGTYQCRARGLFRKQKIKPMIGDYVEIQLLDNDMEGYIQELFPRKNFLTRPAVANIDIMVLVLTASKPKADLLLADRVLLQAEYIGIDPVICINKADISSSEDISEICAEYALAGYRVFPLSAKTGEGIGSLMHNLHGTVCFAGQSGVGKSSLLNRLFPNLGLETGSISGKIERGKHTTRHTELHEISNDLMVLDTPGFSLLDSQAMNIDVESYPVYKEFEDCIGKCKFSGCVHKTEPECAVKEKLLKGKIAQGRYDRYIKLLDEVVELRRNRFD